MYSQYTINVQTILIWYGLIKVLSKGNYGDKVRWTIYFRRIRGFYRQITIPELK